MHSGARLAKAIRACPRVPLTGVWYRSVDGEVFRHFYDRTNPMRPLWGLGAPMSGARFTPRRGPSSLYVAEDLETATREGLQVTFGTPVKPAAGVTRAVYTVNVELVELIDLRESPVRTLLGTTAAELAGAWRHRRARAAPPTQRLGRMAAALDVEGLLFQSTKAAGACLVIFLDNLRATSRIEVADGAGVLQRLP